MVQLINDAVASIKLSIYFNTSRKNECKYNNKKQTNKNKMGGLKGKSGGARPGAGRKALKKKDSSKLIRLSKQSKLLLEFYSSSIGISQSDIVDTLCLLYLCKENKDIIHCPTCGNPIFFEPVQGTGSGICEIICKNCKSKIEIEIE